MDSLDEMEHPLLGSSPKRGCHSGAPINTGGHLRGAPGRVLPSLAWRGYCSQPELLDPGSLPATLEPYYSSGPLWGYNDPRGLHKEYLETTFMDVGHCPQLERKLFTEAKDAHSVSYSMEDEDDLLPDYEDSSSEDFSDMDSDSDFPLMIPQDYLGLAFFSMLCCFWPLGIGAFYLSQKTNKESAKGNFQAASVASRQALWLSVLSIVFGIITYMCAIAALISYLSGKPS